MDTRSAKAGHFKASFPRWALLLAAGWLAGLPCRAISGEESPAPAAIDFRREIEPLLKQHCHACHGAAAQSAGLRLDSPEEAAVGGISGRPVLGGTRETNELYRRIASDDPAYRMPKNSPQLSAEEIERLGRWVDEASPWPDPPPSLIAEPVPANWWQQLAADFVARGSWIDRLLWFSTDRRGYLLAVLVVHLLLIVGIRCHRMQQAGHPFFAGRARSWLALCGKLRPSHYLVCVLALACATIYENDRNRLAEAESQLRELTASERHLQFQLNVANDPGALARRAYGDPPVPIRPQIPKRLGGEFYRGNCERNPALFNNGHYRTATLRVALCDSQRHVLSVGDAIPGGGLLVKFEIVRAPHTPDSLFTEEYLSGVFLSEQVYHGEKLRPMLDQPTRLEIVEAGQHWVGYFPISDPPEEEAEVLWGLIYVYWGMVRGLAIRGTHHYGIQYDLRFADDRIAEGSDLWLGSLFWTPVLAYPRADKVPLDEWFDYRPIPEIVGDNTTDPELLGIP